jgi:hypothetical protein
MQRSPFATILFVGFAFAANSLAATVNFNFYVDDYAVVTLDGATVGSYNNPAAAGNILFSTTNVSGWHSFTIDYKNQFGTNFLALRQQYPGDPGLSIIPIADLRSQNGSGQTVEGLRADYYTLGGVYQFTVFGGPIDHGALSFTSEIYEGQPGLWAGVYGPSSLFEERLTGDLFIAPDAATAPEPSTVAFILGALLLSIGRLSVRLGRGRPSQ